MNNESDKEVGINHLAFVVGQIRGLLTRDDLKEYLDNCKFHLDDQKLLISLLDKLALTFY